MTKLLDLPLAVPSIVDTIAVTSSERGFVPRTVIQRYTSPLSSLTTSSDSSKPISKTAIKKIKAKLHFQQTNYTNTYHHYQK